ncbi:hypothetical protein BU14_0741s0004 [Porphyra umbilicalis]|uniref:Uncharacterized protein n=1 Tax=Porphyra umbilicalis TaxID=2786 RepID=A0A1X6NQ46_PORUM|nr:hypothetical protein BU14_0741s0004 [Porphyra umbilicalis]|eukprot:OSX70493.1 hypothetical protein BU14_0741s0004 [Porphyra umbilicalis]
MLPQAHRARGIPLHAVVDPVDPRAAVLNQCGASRAMGVCFLPEQPPLSAAAAGGARGADTSATVSVVRQGIPTSHGRRGHCRTRRRHRRRRPNNGSTWCTTALRRTFAAAVPVERFVFSDA